MDFFRRIGTDRHKFKVQFYLHKLKTASRLKGEVYVTIKRGDHKKSTEEKFAMGEDGVCDFKNQILTFQSLTLFFDSEQKKYQEKQGEIRLVFVTKKGDKKLLGTIEFDLAKFANSGKENHKIAQEFGEKVKFSFEYEVYIKYMGEASQTSKSVSKQESHQKKDSSLSKFVAFFKGQEEEDKKSTEKQKSKKGQQQVGKHHRHDKEKEKQKPKDSGKSIEKYTKKPIQPMSEKRDKRKVKNSSEEKEEGEDSDDEFRKITIRGKKNIVTTRGKDTMTEKQSGSVRDYQKNKNMKENSDEKEIDREKVYFDVPSTFAKNGNKNPHDYASDQQGKFQQGYQSKNHTSVGMKRTEKNTSSMPENHLNSQQNEQTVREYLQKIKVLEKTIQQQNQEHSSLKNQSSQRISSLEEKIKVLQKQNKKLEQKNQALVKEKQEIEQSFLKIPKNQGISSKAIFETERDYGQTEGNSRQQHKIRELEKQKGQLLIKIQSLEEKYSKDFKKYKQICEQYEQEKQESNSEVKGELKKVKEELAKEKSKNEKILQKYQEVNTEMKQFKQKQNELKDQLAVAMNNLSQMKLKIGDLLNDANQENDRSMIDALTLLSQT